MVERSLVLIKPDGTERGLAGEILSRLGREDLKLVGLKMLKMDRRLAEKHYAAHAQKPFFKGVCDYITSGPVIAAVFEGESAISRIREIMGATDPKRAAPGTIRGDYGLDIEKNTIHGSDTPETARNEVALFFSESELFNYRKA